MSKQSPVVLSSGNAISRQSEGKSMTPEVFAMTSPTTGHAAGVEAHNSKKSRNAGKQPETKSTCAPTGPITLRGKRRSAANAVKHGIFSVGLVHGRESKAEFEKLAGEMAESVQPIGKIEAMLVEKLAMLAWRYRRLLQAEAAEVAKQANSLEREDNVAEVPDVRMFATPQGLIKNALRLKNRVAVAVALADLLELREYISKNGLDWDRDRKLLVGLYGTEEEEEKGKETIPGFKHAQVGSSGPDPVGPLAGKYREFTFGTEDQSDKTDPSTSPAHVIVKMLDEEVERLEPMLRDWLSRHALDGELKVHAALVPRQEVADRLQRYEASLERSFDRTLSQLERLQRLRMGQAVLPALKVDVSH